jgi:2-oxo-3-hexenedioate decarboxylase
VVDVDKWADYLADAGIRARAVAPVTDAEPGLTDDDAYRIQALVVAARTAGGERIIGAKLDVAPKLGGQATRVEQPVYGVLTSGMALQLEETLDCGTLIDPGVAPELVFTLGDDLAGPGLTAHDVLDATRWISGGLEVIDSRFGDHRVTAADVVADNAGASRFVLGAVRRRPSEMPDLSLVGVNLETGGRVVATAAGAAVAGHPATPVARLANWLGERDGKLSRGSIILTGCLTDAVPVRPGGSVTATFAHLGSVTVHSTKGTR